MCAPNEALMEHAQVRRYSTRSSASTIGSDDTLVSPVSLSGARPESLVGPEPLILTGPNNKQWIDLDIISPKLLEELRRRNALPSSDEGPRAISKGAAKIKAWARQGRRGVDVRLGRKLDGKCDEYTNFKLTPDILTTSDHKDAPSFTAPPLTSIPELPGLSNTIHEMPGTSKAQELDSDDCAPRQVPSSRSSMSMCDTLPKYEARPMPEVDTLGEERPVFELPTTLSLETAARPSSSHSSLLPTPTDVMGPSDVALSLQDPFSGVSQATKSAQSRCKLDPPAQRETELDNIVLETRDPIGADVTKGKSLPADATANETRSDTSTALKANDSSEELAKSTRGRIASVKLPSDIVRLLPQASQDARDPDAVALDGLTAQTTFDGIDIGAADFAPLAGEANVVRASPGSAQERILTHTESSASLTRRQTLPRKLSPTANVEEVWTALLKAQAKILGPEHPLVYQARYEFSISRRQQHRAFGADVLQALRRTGTSAQETLGLHPLVSTFVLDLELLERLMSGNMPDIARKHEATTDGPVPSHFTEASPSPTEMAIDKPIGQAQIIGQNRPGREPISARTAQYGGSKTTASPTSAKQSPSELPPLDTLLPASAKDPTPPPEETNPWANAYQPPHKPQSSYTILSALIIAAMAQSLSDAFLWVQRTYGPEPQVEAGKVRVRWTCSCGSQLYDDFVERRPGAGRELEAYLNRPRARQHNGGSPTSSTSSRGSQAFSGSSFGTPSSQTSWTSYGSASNQASPVETKTSQRAGSQGQIPFYYAPEPPWLLTCANESRYTPKLAHLDMSSHKITSDRDLALALRNHYFRVNQKWYRTLKLRGLSTLEFVQFEVHQNRFADIRKCPDMPPSAAKDYAFEPGELVPPVGPTYLLHLFKHPEDYDGELITYLRVPKKSGRLSLGVGWGIHLVEGFLPDRVWMLLSGLFALASLVFGVLWAWKKHDVQGAFGVAAWICGLAVLSVGWLQAGLG